ncbi:MAG TPA: hypothetical protein VMF89_16335, partial [Polyangiales bacterium]|nr:hypothetical protein [Polyangiales bacterium]
MTYRGKWVGARVPRVEDKRFLLGEARYVADLDFPRMLHVCFVRSVVAHARIRRIETARARQMRGVVAVLTGEDLAGIPALEAAASLEGQLTTPQPVLAVDKVRFVGEAVAVV